MKKIRLFDHHSLRTRILPSLFTNSLHLYLDLRGTLLDLWEEWIFHHYSLVHELKKAGHVRDYFDLPDPPPGINGVAVARNKKDFSMPENPEAFYTLFPNVILYLFRMEKNLYYGNLRVIGDLPNIALQRPNGIVYIDGRGRLVGFNETFFRFFGDSFRTPKDLLNRAASLFLEPTPESIEEARVAAAAAPDPGFMKTLFAFGGSPGGSTAGLKVTESARLIPAGQALDFTNPTDRHVSLKISVPVPPRHDFTLEVDFRLTAGWHPLLTLSQKGSVDLMDGDREYTIGPDVERKHCLLKRNGLVQRTGPAFSKLGTNAWRFHRAGNALLFYENGKRLLAWHDPNPLHLGETYLNVELRGRSECRITALKLYASEGPTVQYSPLPVTRLKTSAKNAFVINPMDNLALSISHPDIRGYVLENVTEMQRQIEGLQLERHRMLSGPDFGGEVFLGESRVTASVRESATQAAGSDVTILIQGETGTGKEVLARYIHEKSPRKGGPFIKVDCSTLPQELMESELFGHERGAFTGALAQKAGLLEQAEGGTLFLDEAGNLSKAVQAKLLHFLQDHTLTRVGGRHSHAINLRVVTASNIPLPELVARGEFRADLYYRMAVVTLTLPPLRARRDDIPGLSRHFIRLFNERHGRKIRNLSPKAFEKLLSHPWPGNIRELKNTLERAVIFCGEESIPPELLTLGADAVRQGRRGPRPLKSMDAAALQQHFREQGGILRRVAHVLGVTPRALYDKIEKCGLSLKSLRRPR